ncbi:signal peptidase II [Streptomyces sp. NPDC050560]|uniref:signal peptidase II n=1 Tax=Streptomyces sp. NPDC050560 TaxID=3365630 RepID=UPI00379496D4
MAEAERITGAPDDPRTAGGERAEPDAAGDGAATPAPAAEGATAVPGVSVASGAAAAPERDASRGAGRKVLVLFAVAAFAYALDLVSKALVVARLEHHQAIHLIGDWLRLEVIRNPGAAFGMGEAYTVIFTVIAAAVIFVIARLSRKLYSGPWAVALGLLLGGALGNLTDRLFRSPGVFKGAVVDFISPRHFAVFNLADSAIVCGGVLIVLLSFRGLDPDGTVHRD